MFKWLYFLYIISHTHCNSSTFRWLSFRLKSHSCSVSKSHYLQGYCKRGLDRVQQTMVCVPLSNCCLNCICGPYAVLNCFSCVWLWDHVDCSPPGSSVHGDSPGKNAGMGCQSHPQGIFLTQRSKLHLLCFLHWQTGSLRLVPPGKPRYMSTYGQSILLYSRISYNTVKQLYSNKKLFLKKNWACLKEKTPHPMVY